jgi:hypothetical protein
MFTRKDYLAGNCTHEQYYNQFVNQTVKNYVVKAFGIEKIKNAYSQDKSLNSIPLQLWDNIGIPVEMSNKLKEHGDSYTLAGQVCILKAAARQIAES